MINYEHACRFTFFDIYNRILVTHLIIVNDIHLPVRFCACDLRIYIYNAKEKFLNKYTIKLVA